MELTFGQHHSHRWAEHVNAWLKHLGDDGMPPYERHQDVYYLRDRLPQDRHGRHYTPLLTALAYGIGMDEKMGIEVRSQKEMFDPDLRLQQRITEDTDVLMKMFLADARKLLKGTRYDSTAEDSASLRYDDILFAVPSWREISSIFSPENHDADSFIRMYILSRLAQEYLTLESAVTSYHLIDGLGRGRVRETVKQNAENIAWRITGRLAEVMKAAKETGVTDMKGMETDHIITEETSDGLKHRLFHNCPVFGAYKTTDEVLGQKYKKRAFDEGVDFCGVCEEHGKQAVDMFAPVFVKSEGRSGKPLSGGGDYCDFVSTARLSNIPGGFARKIRARVMSGKASRR